ncbi:MAG: PilZ domain-containing protein, partial [Acidobacteria bacterium]|nr:PilZ domain-containing protein [Acidobacteriota bacterium]
KARRLRPPMHCYWGATQACPRNGKITSLGVEGCFVKTKAETQDGEFVFVNCWLPTGRWMLLRGQVNYRLPKVGFGVSFMELAETEREMLAMLLEFFVE